MLGEHLNAEASEFMPIDSMEGAEFVANRDPQQRKYARTRINAKLTLRPANSSERGQAAITGICRDISIAGFAGILESPPQVGSVYWSSFDKAQFDQNSTFVRCMRCRFLNEDAFEAAFAFFTEQPLPHLDMPLPRDSDDLL